MMLYCDTSALVKLYIEEAHSDRLKALVAASSAVALCRIAWAEAHAALARRAREVLADRAQVDAAKAALAADWRHFVVVEVTQAVCERAGDFAETFALRGYDSVQLAAAYETGLILGAPTDFACFDMRLNKAAQVLGMQSVFLGADRIPL